MSLRIFLFPPATDGTPSIVFAYYSRRSIDSLTNPALTRGFIERSRRTVSLARTIKRAGCISFMISRRENWVAVCSAIRLTTQALVCARLGAVDLLLIRDGDRIFACERFCPHEQADLSLGHVANGRLSCPRHLASFDLHDGNISAGWASKPLRVFPARIKDEQIWIDAAAIAK